MENENNSNAVNTYKPPFQDCLDFMDAFCEKLGIQVSLDGVTFKFSEYINNLKDYVGTYNYESENYNLDRGAFCINYFKYWIENTLSAIRFSGRQINEFWFIKLSMSLSKILYHIIEREFLDKYYFSHFSQSSLESNIRLLIKYDLRLVIDCTDIHPLSSEEAWEGKPWRKEGLEAKKDSEVA